MNKLKKYLIYYRAGICYLLTNKNKKVFEILKYQAASKYLYKRYIKKYNFKKYNDVLLNKNSKIVWLYWKQGIKNAPSIVQYCVKRTQKYFEGNGYVVNILDGDNIFDYIEFPEFIISKYNKKIISEAHFSDLIRLELLSKYGGCWIDSTVFFSEINKDIPEYLKDNFFVFKNSYRESEYINSSNWLINTCKDNPIINATRDILYNYWKNENIVIQYYFFHLVFKMVCDQYKNVWNIVPTKINTYSHLLQKQLNNKYDKKIICNILDNTSVHKLFYKNLNYDDKENVLNKILDNSIK